MTQLAAWIRTPVAQSLGWTLVHFVWEGAVLAAALWAMLRLFRAAPARRRYALACLTLAAMPAAFAITLAAIWALRPGVVAVPVHWAAAPLADAPIAAPAARFRWAMILDRLPWAVPVWAAGVAFFYARGLAGWVAVRRLRYRGVCAPAHEWQARLGQLCTRLGIARPVALLESCFTDAPVLIGYWRPVILLPLGCLTGLSAAQVECILLHELAHVMRHDYIVNLLQSLVEGLLFYHPAVWWVSRVVRAERENCCDDRVVEVIGDRRAYAATLALLEERRAPTAALAATGGNLMRRIRRLTMESRGAQTSRAPAASAAVLLAIFAAALTALPAKLPQVRHAHTRAPGPVAMAVAAATPAPQQAAAPLPTPYKKWLREDVAYIITDEERTAFLALSSDAERENFIDQFWQRRDPTPGTPENEFRDEHYRRIAYANEHFTGSVAGWKTDRGRTYIVYGPPDELDDHASGGAASTYPYQQWRYRYIEGVGTNIIVEFVDRDGTGDYQMTSDPSEKEKASTSYRKWLNEDAAYIITDEERAAFLKLASDEEREQFIGQFWQRRGEPFRAEHYRRIAYANEHYTAGIPGWKTDRGRIYVIYGPPDGIVDSSDSKSIFWIYLSIGGAGNTSAFIFEDSDGKGEFRLTHDPGEPGRKAPH
jgi:GWxTD domain-containing protein